MHRFKGIRIYSKFGHPLTVYSFPDVSAMAPLCLFLTLLLPSIGNDTIVKAMGTYKLQGDFPIVSSYYPEIWHPIKSWFPNWVKLDYPSNEYICEIF